LRRFIVLGLLVLLLGVAYALNRLTADWHYVLPVQSGEIAYVTTFDDFTNDWSLYQGRLAAHVENGLLRLTADDTFKRPFSTANQYWGDFDLLVQAIPVAGPANNNNGYGVIFRLQDKGNNSPDDDDFYLFLISSDGYYQVVRSFAGEQKELSAWIPSPLVIQGLDVMNMVRVVAVGDQFRFYVNDQPVQLCIPDDPNGVSTYDERRGGCIEGQMVDALTDSSIANGRLGVVIQTFDEPGVVVDFDNVVVTGPEST
jgi:hypothetical protein